MRINLYGGPGSGKSTLAAKIFSFLKEKHYSVELVNEYVKSWATRGIKVNKWDQVYFFGKQNHYETRWLQSGVEHVVTDCPTLLGVVYARLFFGDKLADSLAHLNRLYEEDYPSYNIYLIRDDSIPYDLSGRYQNLEQAKKIDHLTWRELIRCYGQDDDSFDKFKATDHNKILESVEQKINST